MPESGRRVILKPQHLDTRAAAQLERALHVAIEAQMALASRSAHILGFHGELRQDDASYYIEHEPARPFIQPARLFDAGRAPDAGSLLRITAAIFDALKAAHGAPSGLRVHGGLCPAALLVSADGIEKISDFGFAQAFCSALGAEPYLNLAVAVPDDAEKTGVTAVWEVIAADEFERQDRLCAFVDPEKYRTDTYTGFESGSDIIAAGFFLHLLAEGTHPYLDDPDAHRMVDMSRYLAMARYNGARRPDLRNASDPAVKLWCDLIAKMLATLPQERPTSAAICEALFVHVKPARAGDLVARQFQARLERLHATPADQIDWKEERAAVALLAGNPDLEAEVSVAAKKLLAECDARMALYELRSLVEAENLTVARNHADKLLAMPVLPADLQQAAHDLADQIRHNADSLREIARLAQLDLDSDPEAALAQLDAVKNGVRTLGAGRLLPGVQAKLSALAERVAREEEQARQRIADKQRRERDKREAEEKQRAQDKQKVDEWVAAVEAALSAQEWENLAQRLKQRPAVQNFSAEAERRAASAQQALDAHRAEVQRQEAIRADHAKASSWIVELRKAVDGEKWDAAEKHLARKPALTHWPAEVAAEEAELARRVADFRQTQRDLAQAKAWIERLRAAVKSAASLEQWQQASALLAERARLTGVPAEIDAEATGLEAAIKQQIQTAEIEVGKRREEQRIAAEWLDKARTQAAGEQWETALALLSAPPQLKYFPDNIRADADALARDVRARQLAAQRARADRRRAAAAESARAFVLQVVGAHGDWLSPNAPQIEATEVTFADEFALTSGTVSIAVSFRTPTEVLPQSSLKLKLPFTADDRAVRIVDEKDAQRGVLVKHLQQVIAARQEQTVARWIKQTAQGFLAAARISPSADVQFPAATLPIQVKLGDGKESFEQVATLNWGSGELLWHTQNEPELVRAIVAAHARLVGPALRAALLQAGKELKRYESLLDIAAAAAETSDLTSLQKAAPVRLSAALRVPNRQGTVSLPALVVPCTTFGKPSAPGDVAPLEAALRKVIAESQQASWRTLCDALTTQAEQAGLKRYLKLEANPADIQQPVDKASVTLRLLKRPPVSLEAQWDAATWEMKRKGDWSTVNTLLTPLTPAEKKKGFALPAGIAAGVAVAGGLTMWAISGPSAPPEFPAAKNATAQQQVPKSEEEPRVSEARPSEGVPVDKDPGPTPTPTCAEDGPALEAELRTLLAQASPRLSDAMKEGEIASPRARAETQQVTVEYDLPGLAEPVVALTVPMDDQGKCQLSAAQRAAVTQSVQGWEQLFELPAVRPALQALVQTEAATALAPHVNAELRADMTAPQVWTLENGAWDGIAVLRMIAEPPLQDNASGALELEVGVKIAAGVDQLNVPNEVAAEVRDQLTRLVTKVQRTAVADLVSQLAARVQADPNGTTCTAALSEPAELTSPRSEVTVMVRCPEAYEKSLVSAWDPGARRFSVPDITAILTDLTPAAPPPADPEVWLAALNAAPRPTWANDVTPAPSFTSAGPPQNGNWTLFLPAPWAEPGSQTPESRLPIVVPVNDALTSQPPAELAQALLTGALSKPPTYWPLVERYQRWSSTEPDGELDDFLIEKAQVVMDQAQLANVLAADSSVRFELYLPDKPIDANYVQDTPASLTVRVRGYWILGDDPKLQALQADWNKKLDAAIATFTVDAATKLTREMPLQKLETIVAAVGAQKSKITWLNALLQRQTVEAELSAAAGRGALSLQDAANLLSRIWKAKGVRRGANAAVDFLPPANRLLENKDRYEGKQCTAFAEFFCGPGDCYVLAFGAPFGAGPIDPPAVRRIGPRATVQAAQMLEAALDLLPRAVAAGQPFDYRFGLRLAYDRAMREDLGDAEFRSAVVRGQTSTLQDGAGAQEPQNWSKLDDLRNSRKPNLRYDFVPSQDDTLLPATYKAPKPVPSPDRDEVLKFLAP